MKPGEHGTHAAEEATALPEGAVDSARGHLATHTCAAAGETAPPVHATGGLAPPAHAKPAAHVEHAPWAAAAPRVSDGAAPGGQVVDTQVVAPGAAA